MAAQVEVLGVGEPTLTELATEANRRHELVVEALGSAVENAIAAGHALRRCRDIVALGEWYEWVDSNFCASPETARRYMRMAEHEQAVLNSGATSIRAAGRAIQGLSPVQRVGVMVYGALGYPPSLSEEACRLVSGGMSRKEVAEILGVNKKTVARWVDPSVAKRERAADAERRQRRRAAEREQREQEQRKALLCSVREQGGAIAEVYAAAERMQDLLGNAHREAQTREARRALSEAGAHYRKMRDEIVRALGVS